MVKWGMTFPDDSQKMKEEMDQPWNALSEESPRREDREIGQWVEKLPKFEGLGRKSTKSRSNKSVKPW